MQKSKIALLGVTTAIMLANCSKQIPEIEPDTQPGGDGDSEPDTDAETDSETETEIGTGTDTESDTESDPAPCTDVTCPVGCCAGNECISPTMAQCGTTGATCFPCDPQTSDACTDGACTCAGATVCALPDSCTSGECRGPFVEIDSPLTTELYTVWAADAENVFAAGEGGTIIKYNGDSWTVSHSGGEYYVSAIDGVGPDAVWAAASDNQMFVYNGSNWQSIDTCPDVYHPDYTAMIVIDADNIIAGYENEPHTCRYNGAVWVEEALPTGWGDGMWGFWAESADWVWAVGNGNLGYFNGSWHMAVDDFGAYDIWGSAPDDIWALGGGASSNYHFNGSDWSPVSETTKANQIWGSSSDDIYAVGPGDSIYRWDGIRWVRLWSPDGISLRDVTGSGPDDVWVVGEGGTILHWMP